MVILPAASLIPDARLLFFVNLITVLAVLLFAAAVVYLLLRRGYHRRVEEQKLAAMGTATARILHQIKNPLQTILLHADLLQDRVVAASESSRKEICDAIIGEAQRLTAMLAELSAYAAGSARRLSLAPLPLHDLVTHLGRNAARQGPVEVETHVETEALVLADGYYLQQALDNLITNAFEAMAGRRDGRLLLGMARRGEMVAVSVEDNGPGITPERLETIFQPFISGKSKGMGLGLAICREIVEGHGGRLEVQSRVGEGTTFRVLLPQQPALHEEPPAIPATTGNGGRS